MRWDLEDACDLDAAVLEFAQLLLRHVDEFGLELGAFLVDDIPHRGRGVLGEEALEEEVVLDLDGLLGFERDQVVRSFLPLQVDEPGEHLLDVVGDARVADDRGVTHSLEPPLRAVVREAADVVHVAVADRAEFARERGARTLTHVKAQVQLRDLDGGDLAGDRDALHAVGRDEQEPE